MALSNFTAVLLLLLGGGLLPWIISLRLILSVVQRDAASEERSDDAEAVEWIGNAWILPHPLVSPDQIRHYFKSHSLLIIGDSRDTRIQYGMLIEILFSTSGNSISKNVVSNMTLLERAYVADGSTCDNHSRNNTICRHYHNQRIDFVQLECFREVQEYIQKQSPSNYDALLIATGRAETAIWRQRRQCSGDAEDWLELSLNRATSLLSTLSSTNNPVVVWRNGAYSQQSQQAVVEQMSRHEQEMIVDSKKGIKLLDYEAAIRERINAHISGERGMLFIQLMMEILLAHASR